MRIVRGYFKLFSWIRVQLDSPLKVFLFCLGLFVFSLLSNGLWWRLWALQRDQQAIHLKIEMTQQRITELDKLLKQSQDIEFIERQAKERLDLVDENDLVFVFPEG